MLPAADGPLVDVALPDGQHLYAVVKGRRKETAGQAPAPRPEPSTGDPPNRLRASGFGEYRLGMFDARLRTLLGCAVGEATYAQYQTLIRNPSAVESTDLDYKGEQYGKGTEGAGELAKDVAALANASGGTLILGLREDRATSIPVLTNPEPLTDRLRKNYRETLVLRLDPPVECDIHFIAVDPEDPAPKGLVVISVPPSARAPHAVVGTSDLRDGTLRFPYRNDNHTAHMNLAQVKRAIAASTSLAVGRHDVLIAADHEVSDHPGGVVGEKLVLVLTPDLPGAMPIDSESLQRLAREGRALELPFYDQPAFGSFGVGPRRFIAAESDHRPRYVAHFHADGTVAWAVEGPTTGASTIRSTEPEPAWHSDHVVQAVLVHLHHAAVHATTHAGASGTATARMVLDVGNSPACGLARTGSWGPQVYSPAAQQYASGQAGLLLDAAAEGGTGLVQAAASLLADCFQNFGMVEAHQLTLEGQINLPVWGPHARKDITAWAETAGVEVITDR